VAAIKFSGHTFASFLAGLALGAPPLTVLKANVDVKRARLIQSTLAAGDAQVEDRP
jgi:hypothetical protein